jgi:glutamate carboxypeptidase
VSTPGDQTLVRLRDLARAREEAWVSLVEELVGIESPSSVPAAQARVQEVMARNLEGLGFQIRRIGGNATGDVLLALPRKDVRRSPQLLLGHTDTVWPVGTLGVMPVHREGDRLYGPGVFDMKAGLAQIVLALQLLLEVGLSPEVQPVVLLNSDEELGSPESTPSIRRWAAKSCRVFVLEPALGVEGKLKTSRKASGTFRLRVIGRSAHAGLDPDRGASAIEELAGDILALCGLSDPARGIRVNVGKIRGGETSNTVAAEAEAEVDVRVTHREDAARIEAAIRELEPRLDGCRLEIHGGFVRPPFERTTGTAALWEEARGLALRMGIELQEGMAGGSSDGNTTAPISPTLDGLGAVGDGAHAAHEHVEVGRSLDRGALLAALLLAPAPMMPHR